MAKGPAVVIIARHGARLDAADKQWHLTSPTPYDPPLTYGGWSQGKALGLRIAALLDQREKDRANQADNTDAAHSGSDGLDGQRKGNGAGHKRKKHKVVIHSSPYLRCIQTSTAIAAGLSQFQSAAGDNTATKLNIPRPAKDRNGRLGASPLERSKTFTSPAADPRLEVHSRSHAGPEKILLRIDAFLGEWLSPDYFEDITPPPNSTMMVAGAKADLLRRGDYVEMQPAAPSSKGHFPGGWVKTPAPSTANGRNKTEDLTFPTLGSLAQVLPGARERASSHGHSRSQGNALLRQRSRSRDGATPTLPTHHKPRSYLYEAPVPSYAVSPADPIPRGYFSHARDACIDVDFQWDSMREPQEWGDGGEYGDEWSTMHKRFRKGLAGMMQWYKEHGSMPPKDMLPGFTYSERPKETLKHAATEPVPKTDANASENGESEDDEELVLVLVTHGAGCNALLGAISNQPVLIDVGLAALSMAVRRDEPKTPAATIYQRRASVVDPGMSDLYEMKYLASTDHLRAGVDPSKLPHTQSPAVVSSPSLDYRRRVGYGASATSSPVNQIDSPFNFSEPVRSGWNSSLGSMRRSSSNGSGTTRLLSSYTPGGTSSRASSGLWSSARAPSFDLNDSTAPPPDDMPLLNFDNTPNSRPTSSSAARSTPTGAAPASPPSPGTKSPPALDGTSTPPPSQAPANGVEDAETQDNVAPLRAKGSTAPRRTPSSAGAGLWTPKNAGAVANGLWGPPRMDDVYEHGRGPKRRWTVTERE
ncbi:hypothetical protein DM02DRAFT_563241 [Periconia macrospinosa]|uniref:Phosphoglycerate mutase-like protein n=1 Tax=Periconia macrospinosa TaxID=97972 RepID=A0A2V1DSY4_9PLEO|nr:hypothetical protein DM02DRAFT_563241 [Periconia macrospinosa]